MFKELRSSALFQTENTALLHSICNEMHFKTTTAKFHVGKCCRTTFKSKKKTTNQTKTTLEAIYSPGSGMDDKTIVNMKAGRADSLSRGDGNNKSLIS